AHKDTELAPDTQVTEKEIVYIADKMVSGNRLVSVAERFQEKMDLYADNPEACAAIKRRLHHAMNVMAAIEDETGTSLDAIAAALQEG
ncbi:MAG: phosphohydrolase, partial [Proteobacteria bacterium]|nr:phosphohydrolase [Pseudomonadota bacterium]